MVMKEALYLMALGLLPGLFVSLVATPWITSQPFGVSPSDWADAFCRNGLFGRRRRARWLPSARLASRIDP